MLNELLNTISLKLHHEFGESCKIYGDEEVKQGFKTPCFFVSIISLSHDQKLGERCYKESSFDILYFPKRYGNNTEMLEMSEHLNEIFYCIEFADGDLIHGTKMRSEIVDDVLHFFVNFNLFTINKTYKDDMETLHISSEMLKG